MAEMRFGTAALIFVLPLTALAESLEDFAAKEQAARDAWKAETLVVIGRVVDEDGFGVPAAVVVGGKSATADKRGHFRIEKVERRNTVVAVGAAGFFAELRVADLAYPAQDSLIFLGEIRLRARRPGRARLVFGGDAMMGRRFLKPDNSEAPAKPVLREGSLAEDALAVLRDVAPVLKAADLAIVNLETVVTDGTGTPVAKTYTYWTPPAALDALKAAGVDAVTLGNNHAWDYGAPGLERTLEALRARELGFCGAGLDEPAARKALALKAGAEGFRLLSYSGIAGDVERLQADGKRGGAAAMDPEKIRRDVREASKEAPTVVALHTGTEYSDTATGRAREAAAAAADGGAVLVVGHHPHVPQGLSLDTGVLVAHSLGNLVFDQSRYETLPGLLLVADFEDGRLAAARLVPIVNDDYRPRLATGPVARWTARHIGRLSSGVDVFWDTGGIEVALEGAHRTPLTRKALLKDGQPLRIALEDASFFVVEANAEAPLEAGRDLLRAGGFEDGDADASVLEGDAWSLPEAARISTREPRTGAACLRLFCAPGAETAVSTRYRIAVPEKFTVAGWARVPAEGTASVECDFCTHAAMEPLKRVVAGTVTAASSGWTFFAFDVDRLKGASCMRLRLSARGTKDAASEACFDDVEVIRWSAVKGPRSAPNEWDWLRTAAPRAATAVTLELERLTKE